MSFNVDAVVTARNNTTAKEFSIGEKLVAHCPNYLAKDNHLNIAGESHNMCKVVYPTKEKPFFHVETSTGLSLQVKHRHRG